MALPCSTADAALGSGLASLGSPPRHGESAWASFPSPSPEAALRPGSESQKTEDYLLALVWDYDPAGSQVTPAGLELPLPLEHSDSTGHLSAHLAFPPEHFHLATVSVQVKPLAPRQISPSAKHRVLGKVLLPAGLVERVFFLQPLYLA